MQKVITINLNGQAYQVDEDAYTLLSAYLEQAKNNLLNNQDQAEILSDLEQAIADKLNTKLNSHKTIITQKETNEILKDMGPVESTHANEKVYDSQSNQSAQDVSSNSPKKLYQIREGGIISGLCNGIAAYLNINVTLIRVAFIILTILSHGIMLLIYSILVFVIPYAKTSQEHAQAQGLPHTAQQLLVLHLDFMNKKR